MKPIKPGEYREAIRESTREHGRFVKRVLLLTGGIILTFMLAPAWLEGTPDSCSALAVEMGSVRVGLLLASPDRPQVPRGAVCSMAYWGGLFGAQS